LSKKTNEVAKVNGEKKGKQSGNLEGGEEFEAIKGGVTKKYSKTEALPVKKEETKKEDKKK
jgi:hypothetical protein